MLRNSSVTSLLNWKPHNPFHLHFRHGPIRKSRRRAVFKNGDCNILQSKISRRSIRFLQDIFTTLVDTQWRWTLLVFGLSFILSWLAFATLWWLLAYTHGDLDTDNLPQNQEKSNWKPCVANIHSFTSCFLFSIETQHTIGYGVRSITEECPESIFVMCLQCIVGKYILVRRCKLFKLQIFDNRSYDSSINGGRSVRKNEPTEASYANVVIFAKRRHMPTRRPIMFNVPGRRHAEITYNRGKYPSTAD